MKKYLIYFCAIFFLGILLVAVFNWLVDPFALYNSPQVKGLNSIKTEFYFKQMLTKPYIIKRIKPNALILGSSRAGSGLNPSHSGWKDLNCYNFAVPGADSYMNFRNLQHAFAINELQKVLIALDFFMFNAHRPGNKENNYPEYESRLVIKYNGDINLKYPFALFSDTTSTLFSWDSFISSGKTVQKQQKALKGIIYRFDLKKNGYWHQILPIQKPARQLFMEIEADYMSVSWFPNREKKYSFGPLEKGMLSPFGYFQKSLNLLYKNKVDVCLVISPSHARLYEAMHLCHLWDTFEIWKRQLVAINEKEAIKFNRKPFPLWDFSGYNSINTEKVPPLTDKTSRMKWYIDSNHYSEATGNIIMDLVFNNRSTEREVPKDFGRLLTHDNIEAHLSEIKRTRPKYRETHSIDIKELEKIAEETRHFRSCVN